MGTPTEKNPQIDNLLTSITGKDRKAEITANRCVTCDNLANKFRDELSAREYQVSGMCQVCQDSVFGA